MRDNSPNTFLETGLLPVKASVTISCQLYPLSDTINVGCPFLFLLSSVCMKSGMGNVHFGIGWFWLLRGEPSLPGMLDILWRRGMGGRAAFSLPLFYFYFFHFLSYHAEFRLHRNEMCVVYLTLEIVKGKAVPAMFPFCFCRVFFKSVIKDLYT